MYVAGSTPRFALLGNHPLIRKLEAEGLYLDYSRQRLDAHGRTLLLELAEQVKVEAWIERMFAAEHINTTEDRPALHLRPPHTGHRRSGRPRRRGPGLVTSPGTRQRTPLLMQLWRGHPGRRWLHDR